MTVRVSSPWRPRPLEWVVLGFLGFVLLRAGPSVFTAPGGLVGSRAATVLFSLGLVSALQLLWRFQQLPWRVTDERVRRTVWLGLPLSLLPLAFSVAVVLQSPLVRDELPRAEPRTAITALATMAMVVVGIGLPTFLTWLLVASTLREHGEVRLRHVASALRVGATMLREWWPILFLLSGYEWMRGVVEAGFTGPRDAVMQQADLWLFRGVDPLDLLEAITSKPLTEALAFAYSFYALLFPLVLGTVLMTGGRRALRLASFPLGLGLALAYVSYCLVPVKGPLFTRTFSVPLDTYLVGPVKEAMMDATRISYDCFPSMHTCCTLLLGAIAWRWARKLFWLISPVVALVPLACVYLRYHYVVDVLAGASLAAALWWLALRLEAPLTADLPRAS